MARKKTKDPDKKPPHRSPKYGETKLKKTFRLTPRAWEWLHSEGSTLPGEDKTRAAIIEQLADDEKREVVIEHITRKKKP
jgi:hypothetical protein